MKKLLFRLTKKDFEVQTFRAGGKGGQNQNKSSTGVRIIHPESGAVGEARDSRSQHQNRRSAFERLAASDQFKKWAKLRVAQAQGSIIDIKKRVDQQMHLSNLRIERVDENGRWVEWNDQ